MLIQLNSCIFGYEKRPVVQVEDLALHAGRCTGILCRFRQPHLHTAPAFYETVMGGRPVEV